MPGWKRAGASVVSRFGLMLRQAQHEGLCLGLTLSPSKGEAVKRRQYQRIPSPLMGEGWGGGDARAGDQPVRIWCRNLPTSDFSVSDWRDRSLAASRIWPDAWPASPAAWVTPAMFDETSLVPAAA